LHNSPHLEIPIFIPQSLKKTEEGFQIINEKRVLRAPIRNLPSIDNLTMREYAMYSIFMSEWDKIENKKFNTMFGGGKNRLK